MAHTLSFAWIGLALFLALPAEAQGKACNKCKGQGVVACREHGREDLSHELDVLYCSVVDGCEACGGTGWLECGACEQPEKEAQLAARKASVAAARERLAELDTTMGRPLRKAESKHFVLVWEMSPMKVDKQLKSEHEMLHITLERFERLFADYAKLLDVPEEQFKKKSRVFVWSLPEDHRRGSSAFCDMQVAGGAKLMGLDPNYSVCGNKSYFVGDEQLHRNLIHCVTHLLFSHQQPSNWIGALQGGWIEEGLPHWFEDRYFGVVDNYCFQEQNTRFDFRGGHFKPALRDLVEKGEMPPVAGVMQRNTDELGPAEHAVALALVDYLMATDAKALGVVGSDLRARVSTRDALQQRFKLSILDLEQRLGPWVLANYPAERGTR
jgi:hypothetical protein